MTGFSVFYSWQSDFGPRKIARDFIREAAELAIGRIGDDMPIEDAPRIDEATEGVSGIPAIGETILRKIGECGVFLADVSFVGKAFDSGKMMPNPNVLLELGYAAAKIGWNRLILVMNTGSGEPDQLPFDLKYRRFPFQYKIAENRSDLATKKEKLSADIEMALRTMIGAEHSAVAEIVRRLDGRCRKFMKENADKSHFWESDPKLTGLPGHQAQVLNRLLDLGVIECRPASNEFGYVYTWSYFGRLCLAKLGFLTPAVPAPHFDVIPEPVICEMPDYQLLGEQGTEEE